MSEHGMTRFTGKVALVTGAASGIGQATAQRLAEEGAKVALVDLNGDGAKTAAAAIAESGAETRAYECDVTDSAAVKRTVDQVAKDFGKLDVLCNIAGVLKSANTHEMPDEDFDRLLKINLYSVFYACKAAIPHLKRDKAAIKAGERGVIVNMASTAAIGSHPWMSAYAAAKGGVISFTRALYIEYVHKGIRANSVVAGGIETPLHMSFQVPEGGKPQLLQGAMPLVPMAPPAQAASVVAFLASDDAAYINGTEVRVDGGALS